MTRIIIIGVVPRQRLICSLNGSLLGAVTPTVGSVPLGLFINHVNLIDCSFSTANEIDVILGRSYVGSLVTRLEVDMSRVLCAATLLTKCTSGEWLRAA